jgi:hypothetical protein
MQWEIDVVRSIVESADLAQQPCSHPQPRKLWSPSGPNTGAEGMCVREVVSLIGASLSPSEMMFDPLLLTDRGTTVGWSASASPADFEAINRATALHRLRPVIDAD